MRSNVANSGGESAAAARRRPPRGPPGLAERLLAGGGLDQAELPQVARLGPPLQEPLLLQLLDQIRHRRRRQVHLAGKLGGERVLPDRLQQEERLGREPQGLQRRLGLVQDRLDQLPEVGQDAAGVRPALRPARRHGRPAEFRSQIVQRLNYTPGPGLLPG